jgi:trk system potassium uptake protein TrkH
MINFRLLSQVVGTLLFLEAFLLFTALGVGIFYEETNYFTFGIPIFLTIALGIGFKYMGRGAVNKLGRRDGFLILSSTWLIYSIIGMLPFLFGGHLTNVAQAFYEAMSGFTTTGASVFTNIDTLPHSILWWRSLMHWIGGMGIVFFTVAFLPTLGSGDQQLFSAESTGLKIGKLHPKITTTARWLWSLYVLLSISCTASYHFAGMDFFDAINHGLSTVATGGFSTHQDSLAYFNNPNIEWIAIAFMFISSVNFTLVYMFFIKRQFREVWKDGELRFFVFIILFCTLSIGTTLCVNGEQFATAFRDSTFTTVALISTTGFVTADFNQWHPCLLILTLLISAMGACAGSTSGGIKAVRVLTAYKLGISEFRRLLHPKAVFPLRINNKIITTDVARTVFVYFALCFALLGLGTMTFVALDYSMLDALSLSITSFSNVGPGIGHEIGPIDAMNAIPDIGLWMCSFLMLVGRLEIFSLLLPLFPDFWKDK